MGRSYAFSIDAKKFVKKYKQGTINCGILESGIGGSGDPRRKWEEMGEQERERERERECVEKCCFCLQFDLKEP